MCHNHAVFDYSICMIQHSAACVDGSKHSNTRCTSMWLVCCTYMSKHYVAITNTASNKLCIQHMQIRVLNHVQSRHTKLHMHSLKSCCVRYYHALSLHHSTSTCLQASMDTYTSYPQSRGTIRWTYLRNITLSSHVINQQYDYYFLDSTHAHTST